MARPVRKDKRLAYNWPATKDILRCCILGQRFSTSVLTYHYNEQDIYADHKALKILLTQFLYSSLTLYAGLLHKCPYFYLDTFNTISVVRLTSFFSFRALLEKILTPLKRYAGQDAIVKLTSHNEDKNKPKKCTN